MTKKIRLNAFDMNCVGHIQHGMWTRSATGRVRLMLARGQEEKDMPKVDVPAVERIIADTIRPLLRKYGFRGAAI